MFNLLLKTIIKHEVFGFTSVGYWIPLGHKSHLCVVQVVVMASIGSSVSTIALEGEDTVFCTLVFIFFYLFWNPFMCVYLNCLLLKTELIRSSGCYDLGFHELDSVNCLIEGVFYRRFICIAQVTVGFIFVNLILMDRFWFLSDIVCLFVFGRS